LISIVKPSSRTGGTQQSLGQIAMTHRISRATAHRGIHQEMPVITAVQKGC
jgi:hypothetical protein